MEDHGAAIGFGAVQHMIVPGEPVAVVAATPAGGGLGGDLKDVLRIIPVFVRLLHHQTQPHGGGNGGRDFLGFFRHIVGDHRRQIDVHAGGIGFEEQGGFVIIDILHALTEEGGEEPLLTAGQLLTLEPLCSLKAPGDFVGGHGVETALEFLHGGVGSVGAVNGVGNLEGKSAARGHFHLGCASGGIVDIPGEGSRRHREQGGQQRQRGGDQAAPEFYGFFQRPAPFR